MTKPRDEPLVAAATARRCHHLGRSQHDNERCILDPISEVVRTDDVNVSRAELRAATDNKTTLGLIETNSPSILRMDQPEIRGDQTTDRRNGKGGIRYKDSYKVYGDVDVWPPKLSIPAPNCLRSLDTFSAGVNFIPNSCCLPSFVLFRRPQRKNGLRLRVWGGSGFGVRRSAFGWGAGRAATV